jgi:hypothetical protein
MANSLDLTRDDVYAWLLRKDMPAAVRAAIEEQVADPASFAAQTLADISARGQNLLDPEKSPYRSRMEEALAALASAGEPLEKLPSDAALDIVAILNDSNATSAESGLTMAELAPRVRGRQTARRVQGITLTELNSALIELTVVDAVGAAVRVSATPAEIRDSGRRGGSEPVYWNAASPTAFAARINAGLLAAEPDVAARSQAFRRAAMRLGLSPVLADDLQQLQD